MDLILRSCFSRENVQRLQQDLAHMIVLCLERRRARGSVRRKQGHKKEEDQVSQAESESDHPVYLQLATVDNTLSTFL